MPGASDRLRAEAWRWLRMARENLVAAEDDAPNLAIARRIPAFWAHQAAELALKAVLVGEDTEPPKHHDLVELRGACRAVEVRGLGTAELATLNEWAIGARYPADLPDATPDIERLIAHARDVLRVAESALIRTVGAESEEG